jgi:hypothetical protein
MLPLLPALILLLLQGPSNFARLAVAGKLPAVLDAFHRQLAQPGASQLSEREEQVLASLIAATSTTQLSHALLSYLRAGDERPGTPEFSPRVVIVLSAPPLLQDGFTRSQRTRDGPLTIGATI